MKNAFLEGLNKNIQFYFDNPGDKKNILVVKNKIRSLKKNFLNSNKFYVILKNFNNNKGNLKNNLVKFSIFLGDALAQNSSGKKSLIVKPDLIKLKFKTNKKIRENLRYHQTNLGGSIHSDGPQLPVPPKYIIMGCINQAEKGGNSILVSMDKIYNYLKKRKPKTLSILKKKFLFERRGFGNKIFSKPIFKRNKNSLIFRYLREYIESAYKKKKKHLDKKRIKALNYLDALLREKRFQYRYKMRQGDVIILNNNLMAHGRSGFSLENSRKKRSLIRIWIK